MVAGEGEEGKEIHAVLDAKYLQVVSASWLHTIS
jgi:hypothetical protein